MRIGLGLYDGLAGTRGIGPTRWLSRAETLARLPTVRRDGLHGGVSYWDAQFDDARLAIALMRTAVGWAPPRSTMCARTSMRVSNGKVASVVRSRRRNRRAFRI